MTPWYLYFLYCLLCLSSIADIILSAVLESKYRTFESYIDLLPNLLSLSEGLAIPSLTCGIVLSALLLFLLIFSLGLLILQIIKNDASQLVKRSISSFLIISILFFLACDYVSYWLEYIQLVYPISAIEIILYSLLLPLVIRFQSKILGQTKELNKIKDFKDKDSVSESLLRDSQKKDNIDIQSEKMPQRKKEFDNQEIAQANSIKTS